MAYLINGGVALVRDDAARTDWSDAPLAIRDDAFVSPSRASDAAALQVFDAEGLLVLPGMVDLHGDAFERQLQPRPGTAFSHPVALADTDRQLVCNGITTACHGLTYSWEGGLRGRDAARAMLAEVDRQKPFAHTDHRIHLRFENHHARGLADALAWIAAGQVDFFAFNDHLPSIAAKLDKAGDLATYAQRGRCSSEMFLDRLHAAMANHDRVDGTIATLAAACRARGVPMASHDDESTETRTSYQALGVHIAEFPKTAQALRAATTLGNPVVMGAPNVLLGGSHCGGLSAADTAALGLCTILASDYYYPSMLHAAFHLAATQICSLPDVSMAAVISPEMSK